MATTHADELAAMFARYREWAERQPAGLTWADFLDGEHVRLIRQHPEMYSPTPDEDDDGPPDEILR